jgi:pyrroloquinoline-quinone synthase
METIASDRIRMQRPTERIAMELIARLDAVRDRWNVLDHPFYRRWECGELTRDELAYYAGQYRHAVVALADAAAVAAPVAGAEHATEEREHVALWDAFAAELGVADEQPANPSTAECADAWRGASDELEALAILYAVEAGQPEVSSTKLAGLAQHYDIAADSPAAAYFALHAERDVEHAEHSRAILEERAGEADDRLVAAAEAALRGNWRLLDAVA